MDGAFLLLVLFWVFAVWVVLGGGAHYAPRWGDGHFGHVRFKFFLEIDFDGHLFDGWSCWMLLLGHGTGRLVLGRIGVGCAGNGLF